MEYIKISQVFNTVWEGLLTLKNTGSAAHNFPKYKLIKSNCMEDTWQGCLLTQLTQNLKNQPQNSLNNAL